MQKHKIAPKAMQAATLLIEFRYEDLPDKLVAPLRDYLGDSILAGLGAKGFIDQTQVQSALVGATSRRVVIICKQTQAISQIEISGPRAKIAYNQAGEPSAALLGFLAKQKLAADSKVRRGADDEPIYVTKKIDLQDELMTLFKQVLSSIEPEKFKPFDDQNNHLMVWGTAQQIGFFRPLTGLLVMWDEEHIIADEQCIEFGLPQTGNFTCYPSAYCAKHNLTTEQVRINDSTHYLHELEKSGVMLQLQGKLQLADEYLFGESPQIYFCKIPDLDFMQQLPFECVKMVFEQDMKSQLVDREFREATFAQVSAEGYENLGLRVILNNDPDEKTLQQIFANYQKVMKARLMDVNFYLNLDQQITQQQAHNKLGAIEYINKLGTQLDRLERLQIFAGNLIEYCGFTANKSLLHSLTNITLLDLSSSLGKEYPALQGYLAAIYYAADDKDLADSLTQCYLFQRQRIAAAKMGLEAAGLSLLLDLEKIAGLFHIKRGAKGGSDPYGLRISARRVLGLLAEHPQLTEVDVYELCIVASGLFAQDDKTKYSLADEIFYFLYSRLSAVFEQKPQFIEAVLAGSFDPSCPSAQRGQKIFKIASWQRRVAGLVSFYDKQPDSFQTVLALSKRLHNILDKSATSEVGAIDPSLFEFEAERRLHEQTKQLTVEIEQLANEDLIEKTLEVMCKLNGPLAAYFDEVMVNTDDKQQRANRLAQLVATDNLFGQVANLRRLAGVA